MKNKIISLGLITTLSWLILVNFMSVIAGADTYRYVDIEPKEITQHQHQIQDYWSYLTPDYQVRDNLTESYLSNQFITTLWRYVTRPTIHVTTQYSYFNRINGQTTSSNSAYDITGQPSYGTQSRYDEENLFRDSDNRHASGYIWIVDNYTDLLCDLPTLNPGEQIISATVVGINLNCSVNQGPSSVTATFKAPPINLNNLTWYTSYEYHSGRLFRREKREGVINFQGTYPLLHLTIKYSPITDSTPPVTTATINPPPVEGLNNTDVTVTLTATDPITNSSGVKEIHYSKDGQPEVTVPGASAVFSVAGRGLHTVTFYAKDNAGNSETPKTQLILIFPSINIVRITNQGPIVNPNESGEPFFTHNGELNMNVTDLTIPGRGMPFQFTRTYRSQIDFNGTLGYGWDFNYNERLIEKTADNKVIYLNGSARVDEFTKNPDGSYTAPVGFYVELTKLPDGTFQLLERDGTKKIFASSPLISTLYALRSITDRNNNRISFQYNTNSQLVTVIDTLGREIKLKWNDKGRLDEIEDFNGRKVKYTYDTDYNLVSVSSPATDEYPQGNATAYTYSNGFTDTKLNHNLLSVTDLKSQIYLVNSYNEGDRITTQNYGGDNFQISYVTNTDNTLITTIIDRKGYKTVYYHNQLGNAIREDVYTQSQGIITTYWEYNANGERTRTILPKSNSIESIFDSTNPNHLAQGNLLSVTRRTTNNESLTTIFTYEPRYNQVKSITDALGRTTTFYFDCEESGLGDLNGDGNVNQANGNIVKIVYPTVTKGLATQNGPQEIAAKFWYNQLGQLVRSIDPDGYANVNEYYTSGLMNGYLYRIIRDFGGLNITNTFEYDTIGNITGIYDGKGNKTAFTVNALNQIMGTVSRLGHYVRFHYDANGNIDRLEVENKDKDGNLDPNLPWIASSYYYDILDNLISKTEQVSAAKTITTQYGCDKNGNRDLITQPEGNQIKNIYDERNLLVETIRGYGTIGWTSTKRQYDLNGNMKNVVDGRGKETTYLVDGFDRMTGYVDALGNRMEQELDAVGNVTRVVRKDASGVILSEAKYLYDELNRNYETQEWLNTTGGWVITRNEFDKNSRIVRTIDANNHQRFTEYDGMGRVKSATDHLGNKVEYTYDENSNVRQVKETELTQDAQPTTQDFITSNEYDNLDRLIKSINPIGIVRGYSFDSRNNLVYSIDGEGNTSGNVYDGLNRLIRTMRDLREGGKGTGAVIKQVTTQYQWDDNSRLGALLDDNGNTTSYQYDALNRRRFEYLPDGTSKELRYDATDNIEKIIDANGTQITQSYDDINRLTRKDIIKGTGVIGGSFEELGYDGLSRMTSARNDYSQVVMQYDSLSKLLNEQQKIGTQSVKSVASAYDLVGNRTGLTYPSGKVVNFVPDELNRIKQITNNQQLIAAYNYTGPFRVNERTYANNTQLTVDYDANRRVTNYEHQKIEDIHHGKQWGHHREKETLIAGFEYAYDKENNKLYEKLLHEPKDKGDAFVYDSIYRLTGVKYEVLNLNATADYADYTDYKNKEEFNLDGVGNRTNRTTNNLTTNYSTNNLNQYTQIGNQILTYDKNGNLTSRRIPLMVHLKERFGICDWAKRRDYYKDDDKCEDEDDDNDEPDALNDMEKDLSDCRIDERKMPQVEIELDYLYDYANRLVKVNKVFYVRGNMIFTRTIATYTYDALGRRISKTTSNFSPLTSNFYYDGARIIEEYKIDCRKKENPIAQYVYGNGIDEVLQMTKYKGGCRDRAKTYYYHENALGSIYAITNEKGKVVERYEYEAYGEVTITGPAGKGKRNHSTIGNRFMFTGREYDSETGLYYYRARYYSAEMGRFLQRDAVPSVNLYAYVNNNPANFIDPFGLKTKQPTSSFWSDLLTNTLNMITAGYYSRAPRNVALVTDNNFLTQTEISIGTFLTCLEDIPTLGYAGAIYDAQLRGGWGAIWSAIEKHTQSVFAFSEWGEAFNPDSPWYDRLTATLYAEGKITIEALILKWMYGRINPPPTSISITSDIPPYSGVTTQLQQGNNIAQGLIRNGKIIVQRVSPSASTEAMSGHLGLAEQLSSSQGIQGYTLFQSSTGEWILVESGSFPVTNLGQVRSVIQQQYGITINKIYTQTPK
ncbi:MAG: RHS repeat-associated core domain-containing protein [Planctomycetota bacterium]